MLDIQDDYDSLVRVDLVQHAPVAGEAGAENARQSQVLTTGGGYPEGYGLHQCLCSVTGFTD